MAAKKHNRNIPKGTDTEGLEHHRATTKAQLTLGDLDLLQLANEQIDALCALGEEHAESDPRLLTIFAVIAERCEKQKAILAAAEVRNA